MTSLREAQEALAAYDKQYWIHAPGYKTIQHVFNHLILTVSKAELHTDVWAPTFPVWVPSALIEHAIRLANDSESDLGRYLLLGDPHRSIEEWLHTCWKERQSAYARSLGILLDEVLFRKFIAGLAPIAEICERAQHGEEINREKVMAGATHLLRSAVLRGPLAWLRPQDWFRADGDYRYRDDLVARFLAPFQSRLETLLKRRLEAHV